MEPLQNTCAPAAQIGPQRQGLAGSTLKLIAIFTMFLDHLGAGVLGRLLAQSGFGGIDYSNFAVVSAWVEGNGPLLLFYLALRFIGRLAFPIFCFLLVEGFEHTHSRRDYALRLALFAVISEVPFDLLFKGQPFYWNYQNVYLTLLAGVLAMLGMRWAEERPGLHSWQRWVCMALAGVAGMALAELCRTDYGAIGVFCILVLYLTRKSRKRQLAAGAIVFLWEVTAPLAFIPIGFYNGRRGLNVRILFYLFYPAHILLLWLLCLGMGLAGIAPLT